MSSERPTNRLAGETSPYLLQHATNPVDWYPWGPEALQRARSEQRPIFLSIGYSACHWCHVMEAESFEDPGVAELLNRHFVPIKVDREERPDLDEIYMQAVLHMTGSGGWPMSVFLTPDLEPFWGGTYLPPHGAYGRPGFSDLLVGLARAWEEGRERLVQVGSDMARRIAAQGQADSRAELRQDLLQRSLEALHANFDARWGGFGSAPKFPHAMDLRLCLRHHQRTGAARDLELCVVSLERMAAGGIHDQLGGGFHRYSTDERWLVPHFEKMLYDNALLVPAYLEAHLVTGREDFAQVARGICDWVLGEMTTPEGGFASSQDADSEGGEGYFFTWTPDELTEVLGSQRSGWAQEWWDVGDAGNFEDGRSIPWRPEAEEQVAQRLGLPLAELREAMAQARVELLAVRRRRPPPATDDKVLTAWNGLMISALASAYQVLGETRYLDAARRATRHALGTLRQPDGRLYATARAGVARHEGCLDDYAFLIQGLIDLYESDFDGRWLREALDLTEVLEKGFRDGRQGGYFTTGADHEPLIARLKGAQDGALPSGAGVHALSLLRLAELTGSRELASRAQETLLSLGRLLNGYPEGFAQALMAADFLAAEPLELVLSGEPEDAGTQALLAEVRGTFLPQRVVALAHAGADESLVPLLRGRTAGGGGSRVYLCRGHTCQAPLDTVEELRLALGRLASPP